MKQMIINEGRQYWFRDKNDNRTKISGKKAEEIFSGWKAAGLKIRRKYGMGGRVTWVWPEDQ